jgi:hypothetical protein
MKKVSDYLFKISLFLAPVLFFTWAVMDSLTYHYNETVLHQYMYPVAFVLPLVSLVFMFVSKYVKENRLVGTNHLVHGFWFLGLLVIFFCFSIHIKAQKF